MNNNKRELYIESIEGTKVGYILYCDFKFRDMYGNQFTYTMGSSADTNSDVVCVLLEGLNGGFADGHTGKLYDDNCHGASTDDFSIHICYDYDAIAEQCPDTDHFIITHDDLGHPSGATMYLHIDSDVRVEAYPSLIEVAVYLTDIFGDSFGAIYSKCIADSWDEAVDYVIETHMQGYCDVDSGDVSDKRTCKYDTPYEIVREYIDIDYFD